MAGGTDDGGPSGEERRARARDPGGWGILARRPVWRGASVGAMLSVVAAGLLAGWFWRSGFGWALDLAAGSAAGLLLAGVGTAAAGLLLLPVRTGPFPRRFVAAWAGSIAGLLVLNDLPYIGLGFPESVLYPGGVAYVTAQAVLFGSLWHLSARRPGGGRSGYLAGGTALTVAVAANVAGVWWLASPGPGPVEELSAAPVTERAPEQIEAPGPAAEGEHVVQTLTYGSGENPRRPETERTSTSSPRASTAGRSSRRGRASPPGSGSGCGASDPRASR